jgi:hypothetical protein
MEDELSDAERERLKRQYRCGGRARDSSSSGIGGTSSTSSTSSRAAAKW